MKKSILFLGHSYHEKTRSNLFFINMLKDRYDITHIYFDPYEGIYYGDYNKEKCYDILILWQIMLERQEIFERFKFSKGILVPMYDAVVYEKNMNWLQYCDFKILCFSKTIFDLLAKSEFDTHYAQYFTENRNDLELGNEKSVFFWQRKQKINLAVVEELLKNMSIEHIHIHRALDPNNKFIDPGKREFEITFSNWFNNPEEYKNYILKSAIYIAPREYEGIGMSFLEAMAIGRCVIAPNNATMNEYIVSGFNGILYDLDEIKPLDKFNVQAIQKNAYEFAKSGFVRWMKHKRSLLDWIENEVNVPKYSKIVLPIIEEYQNELYRKRRFCDVINKWLVLNQNAINLSLFFNKQRYNKVAIYGIGELGQRLYDDLKKSTVTVCYGIDQNYLKIKSEIEVISPKDTLKQVDVIVVTAIHSFDDIESELNQKCCFPILSLEKIINIMYKEFID